MANNALQFRDEILEYIKKQKTFIEDDIKNHRLLSDDEKVEAGLLIKDATVVDGKDDEYKLSFAINGTKLRAGDRVVLRNSSSGKSLNCIVVDNQASSMIVQSTLSLASEKYNIEVSESVFLDNVINLTKAICPGKPGMFFIRLLAGTATPFSDTTSFDNDKVLSLLGKLNEQQQLACKAALGMPPLYCIQGPPGTGKTEVLATIAVCNALMRHNVLILAKTHQAVNNALNKIHRKFSALRICKIGSTLKSTDLDTGVSQYKYFYRFLYYYKKHPNFYGTIVGMTTQAAVLNMGLRASEFNASVTLIDEASQISMPESACFGAFGSESCIFIGDDKQMAPIFHEKLVDNPLSVSIFNHLIKLYPEFEGKLSVTYRMNKEITDCVSRNFYEPYGEKIISSDYSADQRLVLNVTSHDERISSILRASSSIHLIDVNTNDSWEDFNLEEARFAAKLIKGAMSGGMNINDIAVITPFRRQVLAIRECAINEIGKKIPIIDTVERLQGQDVDMIIISLCVSSLNYFIEERDFILNPKRLNVMISRAKKKVIILKSKMIDLEI